MQPGAVPKSIGVQCTEPSCANPHATVQLPCEVLTDNAANNADALSEVNLGVNVVASAPYTEAEILPADFRTAQQGTLDAAADSLASIQRAVNAIASLTSSSLLDEVAFQTQSPVEDVRSVLLEIDRVQAAIAQINSSRGTKELLLAPAPMQAAIVKQHGLMGPTSHISSCYSVDFLRDQRMQAIRKTITELQNS